MDRQRLRGPLTHLDVGESACSASDVGAFNSSVGELKPNTKGAEGASCVT